MFGLSMEHLMIIGVVLLFFGPKRLPELGKTLGQGIRNFKSSLSGPHEEEKRQISDS
jgi:sec-independent protein translocase protein TatA